LEHRACECYQIVKREFEGLSMLNDAAEREQVPVRAVVTRRIDKSALAYRHPPVNSSSAVLSRAL